MIGTPSNKALLREAELLSADGEGAEPNDLVIAVRASDSRRGHGRRRGHAGRETGATPRTTHREQPAPRARARAAGAISRSSPCPASSPRRRRARRSSAGSTS